MSITLVIVIVTAIISIQGFNRPAMVDRLKHYPYTETRSREWYRLITSGFVHGGWIHLLINMFVFYEFGRIIEANFVAFFGQPGRFIFLVMYLLSIVAGDLPTLISNKDNPYYASIGASGAVSAIVFVYIILYPWQLLYLYGILPIPAIVAGVLYLIYSSWASKRESSRIDHNAHFYGALFGVVFIFILKPSLAIDFFQKLLDLPF